MSRPLVILVLLVLSFGVMALSPLVGSSLEGLALTPLSAVTRPDVDNTESLIFWQMRLPRSCLAFLAGMGLAICGMAFQAMFRNPLATPFTLGLSSGASLGAAVYVRLGLTLPFLGVSGISLAAFAGALLAAGLVYGLTRLRRGFSTATMLLAGVAVSYFFSSLILFVQYTSDLHSSFRILRWLMGGLQATVGFRPVLEVAPVVVVGGGVLFFLTYELNLLTTGEELAISRGVDVERLKRVIFLVVALMVGGVVAVCGPIGFVGLMCPHICRLMVGSDHRYLTPATLLLGGGFLVACDTAARLVVAPAEMPVGVVTAFLGGPFFLWLLLSGSSEKSLL